MLVLFIECWGSNLSIQAGVGKLNEDLHQPSGIRYESRSFSVRCLVSLAYMEGLIFGVKLSVVVPQAIGISLRNRIGDSTRDVPCLSLGFGGKMCLILLTCSLFLHVSVSHFIVCSSIETPLYWFDPWPAFYHCLLCIRRFLAKSHIHTWIFGQKSCIHVGFWTKSAYTCSFLAKSHVHMQLFFKQSRTSSLLVEFDVVGSFRVGCEQGWY